MNFDQILSSIDADGTVTLPDGWGQGRALFGGVVGAILYRFLEQKLDGEVRLRSFSLSFVAPAQVGEGTLQCDVLRQGKSVTQAMVTLRQQEQVVAVMLASLGAARESNLSVNAPAAPQMAAADNAMKIPNIPGVTPDFLRHFDMRYASGKPPFMGSDEPDFAGYMRFASAPQAMSTAALIALVDTWPPSVLPMLKGPAPASSLTWTMELLDEPSSRAADTLWQYEVKTDHFSDGYGQSRAIIWDEQGHAVALSRQTITVFA